MSCSDFRIPRGYRFNPSDEELLSDLEEKNNCNGSQITAIIPEIDMYNYEPRQLPELALTRGESLGRKFFFLFFFWFIKAESWSSQRKWYFFTQRDYKYTNSTRSNRSTGEGYYKITGKNRPIRAPGSKAVIGWKRTLTFYLRGVAKPLRTGWVLHEYYLIQERSDPPKQIGEFVVCCLKDKSDDSDHDKDAPFCNRGSRSCSMASNAETQAEENWSSIEPVNAVPVSNGIEDEAETGGGMITEEEENRAYKELENVVQVPIGNPHDLKGTQTDRNKIQDDLPTPVEGLLQSNSSDMIEGAHENGESSFHQPQAQAQAQALDDCYSTAIRPPTSIGLEAVLQNNSTNDDCIELQSTLGVKDLCFSDNNEFSTYDEDDTMYDVYPQLRDPEEANLDSIFHPFQPQDYCALKSPIYTKLGYDPHYGECNNWQSAFKKQISRDEVDMPVRHGMVLDVAQDCEENYQGSGYTF